MEISKPVTALPNFCVIASNNEAIYSLQECGVLKQKNKRFWIFSLKQIFYFFVFSDFAYI